MFNLLSLSASLVPISDTTVSGSLFSSTYTVSSRVITGIWLFVSIM